MFEVLVRFGHIKGIVHMVYVLNSCLWLSNFEEVSCHVTQGVMKRAMWRSIVDCLLELGAAPAESQQRDRTLHPTTARR